MLYESIKKVFKETLSITLIVILVLSLYSVAFKVNASTTEDNSIIIFQDNFNRTDRDIHNDNGWYSVWESESSTLSHVIENGHLMLNDYSVGGFSFSQRPASEATLNQRVSVDILNLGSLANYATANIYLRFTGKSTSQNSAYGYRVVVTNEYIQILRDGNLWDSYALTTGGEKTYYSHCYGNTYRIEFVAVAANPTKLYATLYDVTAGNVAVAATNGTDSTSGYQIAGTTALGSTRNGAGQTTAIYDNYIYEQTDKIIIQDDFNRDNSQIGNDWVASSKASGNIVSNSVILKPSYNNKISLVPESAWIRPMSEATLNQSVSAEFQSVVVSDAGEITSQGRINSGGVIIARCQGETANASNCYYYIARLGFNGADAWRTDLYLYNTEGVIATGTISRDPSAKYRLELSVTSVSDTESKVTAYFHDVNAEGNITGTATVFDIIDDDPNLQKAGTVGFSAYAEYATVLSVEDFLYTSPMKFGPENCFNFLNFESDIFYKNNYVVVADNESLGKKILKEKENIQHISYCDTNSTLDSNSGYIALAITADTAGDYPIRLRFRIGSDSQSEYDRYVLENGNPYAVIIANGKKYCATGYSQWDVFFTTDEILVTLNEGVNIVYFMASTAELVDSLNGVFIDYDCLFLEKSLRALNGTFLIPGDVNNDKFIDVRDVVRLKKYLVGNGVQINYFSADLIAEDDTNRLNSADLVKLRHILLDNTVQQPFGWLEHIDTSKINPLSVITEETGGAENEADVMLDLIRNSADSLNVSGTSYYFSQNGDDFAQGTSPQTAWKTLDKLKEIRNQLKPGDGIFFERGSIFRQNSTDTAGAIYPMSGVSYGAYGVGAKPQFYGSSQNYADAEWDLYEGNIWKRNFTLPDTGVIVFDNGSYVGIKRSSLDALTSGNDYYHDTENGVLYLYSALGCPSDIYRSIEIGCSRHFIVLNSLINNVKIDNLDIRYVGAHAIKGDGYNNSVTITNCEFSWIGGSIPSGTTRYGNAVEFWDSCSNITIENCLAEQVYDAAFTFQGSNGSMYSNIAFKNNLIRYCNYSIEFFIRSSDGVNNGLMSDIDITGNIMQYAGYGFCEQRPSKVDSAHICGWATDIGDSVQNFYIKDNIFDLSAYNIVNWTWNPNSGISVSDNIYYMKSATSDTAMKYGVVSQIDAINQATLEGAVAVFDSTPKKVAWLY